MPGKCGNLPVIPAAEGRGSVPSHPSNLLSRTSHVIAQCLTEVEGQLRLIPDPWLPHDMPTHAHVPTHMLTCIRTCTSHTYLHMKGELLNGTRNSLWVATCRVQGLAWMCTCILKSEWLKTVALNLLIESLSFQSPFSEMLPQVQCL